MREFTSESLLERSQEIGNKFLAWTLEKKPCPISINDTYWFKKLCGLFETQAMLEQRIAELEQERRWIHQDKTMIVKKDGDSWCAMLPDFIDLQQSESRWFSGDLGKYMDAVYWYLNDEPQPPKEEE